MRFLLPSSSKFWLQSRSNVSPADAWLVSAHDPADVATLHDRIVALFEAKYAEATFTVPYDRQGLVSEMHESGRVVETRYEEVGVLVTLRAPEAVLTRFRATLP